MGTPDSEFVAWYVGLSDSLRALVVAITTLALTGAGALATLAIQHWLSRRVEEREERRRRRERLEELRRSVYLPAATAVGSMMGNIARALDYQIDNGSLAQVTLDFGTAITRVNVVASGETIRKVSALQRAALGEYMISLALRQELVLRQARLTNMQARGRDLDQELARYVEMMKAMNIERSEDAARFDALQRQAQLVSNDAKALYADFGELNDLQLSEGLAALRAMTGRLEGLVEFHVDALIAIRSEMGIESDADALRDELRKNGAAAREQLSSLMKRFEDIAHRNSAGAIANQH